MARITYIPNRVIDTNGISDGASIYVYQTGTSTPVSLFTDSGLSTPASNPYVVAAGAAVPALFHSFAGDIRIRVVESGGTVVSDDDPYIPIITEDDLADEAQGAGLIRYKASQSGADARWLTDRLDDQLGLKDFGVTPASAAATTRAAIETGLAAAVPFTIEAGSWGIDQRAILPDNARINLEGTVTSAGTNSVTGAVLGLGQMAWAYLSEEWSAGTSGATGYPGYFNSDGDFVLAPVGKWTLTLDDVSPGGTNFALGDVLLTDEGASGQVLAVDTAAGAGNVTLYRTSGTFTVTDTITHKNGASIGSPPAITAASQVGTDYDDAFVAAFSADDVVLFVADRGYKGEIGSSLSTPPYGSTGAQLFSETVERLTISTITAGSPNKVTFAEGPPPGVETSTSWVITVTDTTGFYRGMSLTGGSSAAVGDIAAVYGAPANALVMVDVTGDFRAGEDLEETGVGSLSLAAVTVMKMTEFLAGYLVLANNTAVYEADSTLYMNLLENAVVEGTGGLVSNEWSPFHKMGMWRSKLNIRTQTGFYGLGGNSIKESWQHVDFPRPRDKPWDIALRSSSSLLSFIHMAPADDAETDWISGVFNEGSRWIKVEGRSCDFRGRSFQASVFGANISSDCELDIGFVDNRFGYDRTPVFINFGNKVLDQAALWNGKRHTNRCRFRIGHAKCSQFTRWVNFEADPSVVELKDNEAHIGFAEGRPTVAAVDIRHNHPSGAPSSPERSVLRPRITGKFQHGDVYLDAAVQPYVDVTLLNGRVAGIPDDCFVLENGLRKYAGPEYHAINASAGPTVAPDCRTGQVGENAYENIFPCSGAGTVTVSAPTGTPIEGQTLTINILNTHGASNLTPSWNAVYTGSPGTTAITPGERSIFRFEYRSGVWILIWSVEVASIPGAVLFDHTFSSDQYWNTTGLANCEIRDGAFERVSEGAVERIVAAIPGMRPGATYNVTCTISGYSAGAVTVALGRVPGSGGSTNFTATATTAVVADAQISSVGATSYQSELRVGMSSATTAGTKLERITVAELG